MDELYIQYLLSLSFPCLQAVPIIKVNLSPFVSQIAALEKVSTHLNSAFGPRPLRRPPVIRLLRELAPLERVHRTDSSLRL